MTEQTPPMLPKPLSEGEWNQVVFALQCKLAVDAHEMLRDFTEGGYKLMGDRARAELATKTTFQPRLGDSITWNLTPILKGMAFPIEAILSEQWEDKSTPYTGGY